MKSASYGFYVRTFHEVISTFVKGADVTFYVALKKYFHM